MINSYGHMDCGPPGSPVHRILQARILEWVAMPSSRASSWPRDQTQVYCTADILYRLSYQGSPIWEIYLTWNWMQLINFLYVVSSRISSTVLKCAYLVTSKSRKIWAVSERSEDVCQVHIRSDNKLDVGLIPVVFFFCAVFFFYLRNWKSHVLVSSMQADSMF